MPKMTTQAIKVLINKAKMDYRTVENEALNAYLSRLFPTCPFTEEPCTEKQCHQCSTFKKRS